MADVENLSQIFNNELFGSLAEEKGIKGIVSKVMEARHSKSSDSYEFLARFCSQERVTQLILPLKDVSGRSVVFLKKNFYDKLENLCPQAFSVKVLLHVC